MITPPIFVLTSSETCSNVNPKQSQRIEYLDTLRVLACFLVVFTHSVMPAEESDGIWLSIISLIGSPSSELFIALSGAILLPIKTDMATFYRKRFMKLLPPLLFWSVILIFVDVLVDKITMHIAFERMLKIPIAPAVGVYWFIYVIIGLYLFAPFVSPWLKSTTKKGLELFLGLWCVTLLMPYLNIISPDIYNANGSYYSTLNYFGGFFGYWVLGFYLYKYPIKIGCNIRWIICCSAIAIYLAVLLVLKSLDFEMEPFFDNLQIGSALLVTFIFTLIQAVQYKLSSIKSIISAIAKYSFGVYLIHIVVIREFVWNLFLGSTINPIIETLIIAIISIGLSYLILKLLSCLPFHKYIIGV